MTVTFRDWQQVEFRLNNSLTWELYDLRIHQVQFHKNALEMTEWVAFEPLVVKSSPKVSCVVLRVQRLSWFYMQNVAIMTALLNLMSLMGYIMPIESVGDRVSVVLTLLLTAVAFKLVLTSILPMVPYNTVIDIYLIMSLLSLGISALFVIIPGSLVGEGNDDDPDSLFVNRALMYATSGLLCFCTTFWFGRAFWVYVNIKGKRIEYPKQGKTWYSYTFGNPPFMPLTHSAAPGNGSKQGMPNQTAVVLS